MHIDTDMFASSNNLQTDLGPGYGASPGTPAQPSASGLLVNTVA
jgi:hypothetical protein